MASRARQTVLSKRDRACLGGDFGDGVAMAMRVGLAAATAMRAPRRAPLAGLHTDEGARDSLDDGIQAFV
jgi:hypothetical protein